MIKNDAQPFDTLAIQITEMTAYVMMFMNHAINTTTNKHNSINNP
jgi:hypothetical protein